MNSIQSWIDTIGVLIPLIVMAAKIAIYIGQQTHSKRLQNLAARADIIVRALEQTDLLNEDKKQLAIDKLNKYAKEAGIKISLNQLEDYVEGAVHTMKRLKDNKLE